MQRTRPDRGEASPLISVLCRTIGVMARGASSVDLGRGEAGMTRAQGQYLAFILLYTKLHKTPPAEVDMQRYFDVTPPSVHSMVLALEKRGFIERSAGRPRSIKVLVSPAEVPPLK
jgi:DNA-binding MarR family transcriptional regulator